MFLKTAFFAVLVVGTVGCGKAGFNLNMSSQGGVGSLACESQLKTTFSRTYFPILSTSCNNCHSAGHGSSDLNVAFSAFKQKGVALIDYKAQNPHGDNGLNLTSEISAIKADWNRGHESYLACQASGGGDGSTLLLNAKSVPNIQETATNQNAWKTVEWDLETDVATELRGRFFATLKIQARLALNGGVVVGLEFRNPSMKLKSSSPKNIEVSGMDVYLDGEQMTNATTYSGIYRIVNSATEDVPLAQGSSNALVWKQGAVAGTQVSLQIQSIQLTDLTGDDGGGGDDPPNTTPVTYAQLVGTDATVNVFQRRCLACHSAANPSGGLNLAEYDSARAAANDIVSRVNSTSNPMPPAPPGTLMPQTDRDVVSRWINSGTPQQ